MPPQNQIDPMADANPELEALTELTMQANESLANIEQDADASMLSLDNIEGNTEAMIVATNKLQEPLEKIAENTANVGKAIEQNAEPISKIAAFLTEMKGDKGEPGKDGHNPLHVGNEPPEKPKIGDLWYTN
jgi:methyl-accepting chemotaxis protein